MHFRTAVTTFALAASLALPACTLAQGMGSMNMPGHTASGGMSSPAADLNKQLSNEASEFIGAAEAMPADKFNFAPPASMGKFDGVRTFAQEIKHVTEVNYGVFRGFGLQGGKSRADIEKLTNRDEILAALKESFEYAHNGIATITPQNAFVAMGAANGMTRVDAAIEAIAHPQDHYGQMVEYLRMNGIIPPASRK